MDDVSLIVHKYRGLSQIDPDEKQAYYRSQRKPDTGRWLLKTPEFERWLADDQQVLLCSGRPGSGKTILSSLVVDRLCNQFAGDSTVGIAFLYCNYEQGGQKPENLVSSLLYQLLRRLPLVPAEFLSLDHDLAGITTPPSVRDLLHLLEILVTKLSRLYIVIDALDELSSSTRRLLLSGILELQATQHVNLFSTSRPLPDVVKRFEPFPRLDIEEAEALKVDLTVFIDRSLDKLPKFAQSPEIREEIMQKVLENSNGM
jgi:hypothetical protein